jgi:hypothetical protein
LAASAALRQLSIRRGQAAPRIAQSSRPTIARSIANTSSAPKSMSASTNSRWVQSLSVKIAASMSRARVTDGWYRMNSNRTVRPIACARSARSSSART